MTERSPVKKPDDKRIERLKRASRLIVTTREKMPHSAMWHQSLRRTLWRYTREVLLRKSRSRPAGREERTFDS